MKFKHFTILSFILILLLSFNAAGQGKQYQGRLWKITGNGLDKPSYLYGTMHVSRKVSFHLSDSFFIGLKNSDIIALESDPSTWMEHFFTSTRKATLTSWGASSSGNGYYKSAFKLSYPTKLNLKWLFRSENKLTNGMLYRSSDYTEDYEEDTYLDLFIYQAGKKLNKGIASLENNDTVSYLEKLANRPTKEDIKNRKRYKQRYGLFTSIENAYRDGDLDLLDSLNQLGNPTSVYHHYFIEERNRRMVIKMDSIIRFGKTVFAGVGAAHLPGDVGMIKLFRELGYSVNSVNHEEGKIATKTKNLIEKLKSPVEFNSYTSTDGAFKVDVPGKLFENHYGNGTQYYYPDMGNGGYYQVNRVKHFMSLQEKDEKFILKQLDSLFFENIPGKILAKKEIVVDGIAGYDILNVSKKGEYQRHAIFVSPLEIFYFKAHANGDYMKKESDNFVNSIHFFPTKTKENEDYIFSPPFGEFRVSFPAIPYYSKDSNAIEATNSRFSLQCFDSKEKEYFLFMKSSLHDYYFIEEDSFELGRLSENILTSLNYDSIISYKHSNDRYASLTVISANENNKVIRIYLTTIGANYYLLLTDAKEERATNYFSSFTAISNIYKHRNREFIDTNMYVKVNINYSLEPQDEFNNAYSYYRNYGNDEDDLQDKGYQSKNLYLHLTSPETGETAVINYYKYYKYFTAYDSNYWNKITEFYTGKKSKYPMHLANIKYDTLDDIKTLDYLLVDTGSTKGIKVKMIIKGGVNYSITSLIDTVKGPSTFISDVFNSFQPLDTTIGLSIFKDKVPVFINDLFSHDTISKQHAEQCISKVKVSKDYLDSLILAFSKVVFEKDPLLKKAQLLESIGATKDNRAIPFLEDIYKQSIDTFIYQVAVLEALAILEDKNSFLSLKDLILEEAPLTDNSYKIRSIFYELNDTLELASSLFPDLLELTSYPEYKSNVYSLLAQLLDSNKISSTNYISLLRKITREAKDELKRQYAAESKSSNRYSRNNENYNGLLDDFNTILSPYYVQDERVREYFERIFRSQNKKLKMNTVLVLTKSGVLVNDTFWSFFANEPILKVEFYNYLFNEKKTDFFRSDSCNQLDFARCNLINKIYDYDEDKDTILFIDKRLVKTDDTSGYMYFFKVKQEEDTDWSFAYSGLFSPDTTQLFADANITSLGNELSNKDDISKLMLEVVKEYRWIKRKRISSRRNNYIDNDY